MTKAGWGRIVNIGSCVGEAVPMPGMALYAGTKFAIHGLTRGWSRDLGSTGVTVNSVQPGPIDTELNPADGPNAEAMMKYLSVGRFGKTEEIAVGRGLPRPSGVRLHQRRKPHRRWRLQRLTQLRLRAAADFTPRLPFLHVPWGGGAYPPVMKIFTDAGFAPAPEKLLREGAAPHEVIAARTPATSILAKSEPDPRFAEAEIAFGQPDLASIENSPRLRWVHLTSAGYTRYDTPEFRALAKERGLLVTNSSGVFAEACAEHVFSFMMAQARCLPRALASRAGNGSPEWLALRQACVPLRGQRVLILGYGAIASALVKMLAPFAMQVSAFRRTAKGNEGIPIVTAGELPAALAGADHVIDILPENAESRNFMDAARFSAMKPGAAFYNIGRGATVDQSALDAVLRSGHLGAAWLDVSDPEPLPEGHPLLSAPNCYLTPHTAGGHGDESESLVRHFLGNLSLWASGSPLRDRIL